MLHHRDFCKISVGLRRVRSPASGAACLRQAAGRASAADFICTHDLVILPLIPLRALNRARPDAGREVCTKP